VSLSGTEYFYVNTLHLRDGAHPDEARSPAHGRRAWFEVACCPPNIMRTLASLDSYLATQDDDGVQLHLYTPSELQAGAVRLEVATGYPWDGRIRVRVVATPPEEWTLSLRVPAWATGATVTAGDGKRATTAGSYARLRRAWQAGDTVELTLPMAVRLAVPHDRIDAVRGCVAIERGPLVYAVEQLDQPGGTAVDDLRIDLDGPRTAEHRPDLLDGVTVVRVDGPAPITAVPYYAWANRGAGPMRVWLPRA
jgi:hypothetical protein